MKKIPCVFRRDFTDMRRPALLRDVTPGCEWVLAGEGIATRKWDGTACAIIGGRLFARYDAKNGKPPPPGAIPCDDPDPVTGHWPHWVPAEGPAYRWQREACLDPTCWVDGTYEAVGPRINGNPEGLSEHRFQRHGADMLDAPRDWDGLRSFLEANRIEGIVFHHPDGRMAKIRRDDFGFEWKPARRSSGGKGEP